MFDYIGKQRFLTFKILEKIRGRTQKTGIPVLTRELSFLAK